MPGKPFGWAHEQERQQIFNQLVDEGHDPKDYKIHFEVTRIQQEIHKNDLSFRECQRLKKEWDEIHNPRPKGSSIWFTEEQLEYLRDMLQGVNHPDGLDILEKITVYFDSNL